MADNLLLTNKVYVAVVRHSEGMNLYAAKTEAGMYKEVASYCRAEWTEDCENEFGALPADNKEAVEFYFSEDVWGDRESWNGEIVEVAE